MRMKLEDIVFRDVKDGDELPKTRLWERPEDYYPRMLRWFCPSLSEDDAWQAYCMNLGALTNVASLRALIERYYMTKP
jgi:hypothetical protein